LQAISKASVVSAIARNALCGECVQAARPTGALMPAKQVDANDMRSTYPDRSIDLCAPYCGVGCQITYHIVATSP
jgi:formate dehydrogenase major subunit